MPDPGRGVRWKQIASEWMTLFSFAHLGASFRQLPKADLIYPDEGEQHTVAGTKRALID
jgi:hypothetical protein